MKLQTNLFIPSLRHHFSIVLPFYFRNKSSLNLILPVKHTKFYRFYALIHPNIQPLTLIFISLIAKKFANYHFLLISIHCHLLESRINQLYLRPPYLKYATDYLFTFIVNRFFFETVLKYFVITLSQT
jgi:hypothetical protein